MTCKCKREMIIYRIGADFNKPILFHYCTHCGRVFLYGIAKDLKGKWIESFKSVNSNLIEKSEIRDILKKEYPKEKQMSVRNKTKIELLDNLMKNLGEIKSF